MKDHEEDKLRRLFAVPERPVDEAFVLRVERTLLVQSRMQELKSAAWARFSLEVVASAAVFAVFYLLWYSAEQSEIAGAVPMFGSSSSGLIVVAIWTMLALRPTVSHRG